MWTKNLLLLATAATLSGASGCIIVQDNGPDPGDPLGATFSLTWELQDATFGNQVSCAFAGANTVRVISTNTTADESFVDLFDCDDLGGKTFNVDAGDYLVDVDLVDCGADPDCLSAIVIGAADTQGSFAIYHDGDTDLGHFIFVIE